MVTNVILGLLISLSAPDAAKVAFTQPTTAASTGNLAGQGQLTVSVAETAKRVVPKFVKEANEKFKWRDLSFQDYESTITAQQRVMGDRFLSGAAPTARECQKIAESISVRYIVALTVRELTGYRASGLVARKGGRASIALLVYDAMEKKFVWQSEKTETSVRESWFGSAEALGPMMDQALFNSIRKCLEPFGAEGKRMDIKTESLQVVAKVSSVIDEKTVLLDIGQEKGLQVGDELKSFDGKVTLKVKEVLSNGTVAEVVSGEAKEGLVVRTSG